MTSQASRHPKCCDTFVAYPPTVREGTVIFGKNSNRPRGKKQFIARYPAAEHAPGTFVRCTYLSIPQASRTHAVIFFADQVDVGLRERGQRARRGHR